ncbi:hypothetical protein [uncultured Muribaculum sp.]|uniref:hypothetical protein n=1 Tax=uncultured Muribaculum sp. TaxID=1918613 RepID=UPI0025B755CE|nr:hypothetical protein [uncultured Muribaculum sp.]
METQHINNPDGVDNAVSGTQESGKQLSAQAGEVDKLIAEAEQRGYLRGRNEAAQNFISQPALFEEVRAESQPVQSSPLLSSRRVSIWDLP